MSGKTSNESKAKYNAKAYDRIEIVVKKGLKETIKDYAKNKDLSLNAYIYELIKKDMNIE